MSAPVFESGNAITLLSDGAEFFPALLAAIEASQVEVRLETYIFAKDETGHSVVAALLRAAARKVRVQVVVDGFGSPNFMADFGDELRRGGVEVFVFRPEVARFNLRRQRLRRLHRKLACIDACVAFVGGINIIDDMNTPKQTPPRRDFAVRVEGPLLIPIHKTMRRVWDLLRWANLGQRHTSPPLQLPSLDSPGQIEAAFLTRDNLRHRRDIENTYIDAISRAKHDILIANAYFLPGRMFRRHLIAAAKRGVRVTLLVQGHVESTLQYFATQAIYGQLIKAGVHIYEYHKSFMHAKVAVIDTHWSTVGSSNIDPFSLVLSREANVVVLDQAFATQLRTKVIENLQNEAVQITNWRRRPWYHRLMCWAAFGLVRMMLGWVGYGKLL